MTAKYAAATALFFGAIACEYHKSEVRRRREERAQRGAKEGGRRGGDDDTAGGGGDSPGDDSGEGGRWRPGRRSTDGRGGATREMDRELAPVRIK